MIKKLFNLLLLVFLLSLPMIVTAQTSNSITLWNGKSDSLTYFVRSIDSLTFYKNDSTVAIWQKGAGAYKLKQNQIDSITILNPLIVSTNIKDNETLSELFNKVIINKNSYK